MTEAEQPRTVIVTPAPNRYASLAVAAAVLFVLWFLLWTAYSSHDRFFTAPIQEDDYFNQLARGFRKGHLSLDVSVDPAMPLLADPYDPAQRGESGLHDASYYKGHYYLYFGPAPVLTLLLPFQLLTGRDLQLIWATLVFAVGGYLVLAALAVSIWRRHFPRAGIPAVLAALLVLGCCTMVPSVLRRGHIWEMPIAAGFCYASAALSAAYAALHRRRQTFWFGLVGLFVVLAIASRAVYVVLVIVPAVALLWQWWSGRSAGRWKFWPDRSWWMPALVCGGVLASGAGLLMAYNYFRFDSPFEFGMKYQLTAVYEGRIQHFSPRFLWHDLRIYFLNIAKWSRDYPYVLPGEPPHPGPTGYLYSEWVTAVFPNLPFFALAFVAPIFAWRHRKSALAGWLMAVGVTAATLSLLLSCFVSTADRYMADFLPAWALLAAVGVFAIDASLASRPLGRWVARGCWGSAVVITVLVGIIASIESQGIFSHEAPRRYRSVAGLFRSPLEWLNRPVADPTLLRLPAGTIDARWGVELTLHCDVSAWHERCFPLLVAGRHEFADTIVLLVTREGRLQVGYDHWGNPRVLSPAFEPTRNDRLNLQVAYGAIEDAPEGTRRSVTITADGREIWRATLPACSGLPDRVRVGENDIGATTCEKAFPLAIESRLIALP